MTPQAGAREGLRARAHAPWGLQTTAPALLGTPRRPCVLRSRRRRSRATRAHGRPGLAVMASLCCLALSSSVCFLRSSLISCSRNAGVSGSDPAAAGAPSCAVLFASCGSSPATKRHAEHRNPCPPRQHVVRALDTGRPLALPPCTRGHGGTGGCSCASARGDERGRGTPPRTGRRARPLRRHAPPHCRARPPHLAAQPSWRVCPWDPRCPRPCRPRSAAAACRRPRPCPPRSPPCSPGVAPPVDALVLPCSNALSPASFVRGRNHERSPRKSAMPPVENWKNQARAPPAGARTLWVGDLEEWMDECVPACPPARLPARAARYPCHTPPAARATPRRVRARCASSG